MKENVRARRREEVRNPKGLNEVVTNVIRVYAEPLNTRTLKGINAVQAGLGRPVIYKKRAVVAAALGLRTAI